jgi:PASTA domain-containing protein
MTIAVIAATLLFAAPLHTRLTIGVAAHHEWADASRDAAGPPQLAQAPPTERQRMPDLRKRTLNDAFEILSRYHRKPRVEQGSSDLSRGLVYDQEPPPGTDLATVREIVLHVSNGVKPEAPTVTAAPRLLMPDVRKRSLKNAVGIQTRSIM